MKRTIIGGFIMLFGVLITLSIILTAAIYVPSIDSWSGQSKLWFAIFGAKNFGNEVVQSLFLGVPFIIGLLFSIVGLLILGREYFTNTK